PCVNETCYEPVTNEAGLQRYAAGTEGLPEGSLSQLFSSSTIKPVN
ncbi:MAG: hypothetical protein H6R44_251, partial [Nitrospirae bacterium]|nr:hypothetical protein [Nitrospirota bacterium]